MNVGKVVNSNSLKKFCINLIHLMQDYNGSTNIPQHIDKLSGEIVLWSNKEDYSSKYAIINLTDRSKLTPINEEVKDKLLYFLNRNKTFSISFENKIYVLLPYCKEESNTVYTAGYILKKVDTKLEL